MYEPHSALVGGADGLDLYRRMAAQMRELPRLPEIVGFEVGIHQAEAVSTLLRELEAYESIEIIRDFAGIERHVIGCAKKNNRLPGLASLSSDHTGNTEDERGFYLW